MDPGPSRAAVPHYARIAADLRDRIKDGTYAPGGLLPSRNEITTIYGVSAITARDALSVICHEGYARAVRGRGHIVRRKRSRMTVPGRMYARAWTDPAVPLELARLDVYREQAPDNIALPLETGADNTVWVRRAVYRAIDDRQPVQIHVSWIPGLPDTAEAVIRAADPAVAWPDAVRKITGRPTAAVRENIRARRANPFEAGVFGLPDGTVVLVAHLTIYDTQRCPVEHSRYTWPTDAVRVSDYYPCAAPA
jgi:GntR family transcriptional regulator